MIIDSWDTDGWKIIFHPFVLFVARRINGAFLRQTQIFLARLRIVNSCRKIRVFLELLVSPPRVQPYCKSVARRINGVELQGFALRELNVYVRE